MSAEPKAIDAVLIGETGTGLDDLVRFIIDDPGLNHRVPLNEIAEAARAADAMNHIIVDAISKTGLANDGVLNAADVRDLSAYIQGNHYTEWVRLHGDDEATEETGFHLVQNDGAVAHLFGGYNAVNTVADGIYHLGFGIERGRLLNEDGNRNASVQSVGHWLNQLLAEDLASGALANADVDPYTVGSTNTGLDGLVEIITTDPGLNRYVSTSEIHAGAGYADDMNGIIVEAIKATGVAYNGEINAADVRDLNAYIRDEYLRDEYPDEWVVLHGDDEGDEETRFHLVQNDGATTYLFDGRNAVNTVADGIYHLGFQIQGSRILNEDGNKNASLESLAHWLDTLLAEDLAEKTLTDETVATPYVKATTGTGLDQLVEIITADLGLNRKVSTSEINEAARAADAMNQIILEAIEVTGAANNDHISVVDMRDMNAYIQEEYYDEWGVLHGDDEETEETGFHLVQNDGSTSYLFHKDAVDTVADGIYHMGFDIERGRFLNEDGNRNASVSTVSEWLNELLAEDLADGDLRDPDFQPVEPVPDSVVYTLDQPVEVDGRGDQLEIGHDPAFQLENGSIALSFVADSPGGVGPRYAVLQGCQRLRRWRPSHRLRKPGRLDAALPERDRE